MFSFISVQNQPGHSVTTILTVYVDVFIPLHLFTTYKTDRSNRVRRWNVSLPRYEVYVLKHVQEFSRIHAFSSLTAASVLKHKTATTKKKKNPQDCVWIYTRPRYTYMCGQSTCTVVGSCDKSRDDNNKLFERTEQTLCINKPNYISWEE